MEGYTYSCCSIDIDIELQKLVFTGPWIRTTLRELRGPLELSEFRGLRGRRFYMDSGKGRESEPRSGYYDLVL